MSESTDIVKFGPKEQIVIKFGPQPGRQTDLLESRADIALYGGARGGGKTFGILLEPLRHCQNPLFTCTMFRRTMPEVYAQGGLYDTSQQIYPYTGAEYSGSTWTFPGGARVQFASIPDENSKASWLGQQIALLCFDQLETFTDSIFWYMLACNRSVCGISPYIRATANPEPGWLADFIQWWWNEDTGYPIMERSGVIRWFVRIRGKTIWADTKEELLERFPGPETFPLSFTFIAAFVDDNPILLESDKNYKAKLYAQGVVEAERWLKGNWKIKLAAGLLFSSAWFKRIETTIPLRFDRLMRFWDLAATAPAKGKDPCYTAGALVGLLDGQWYIIDIRRIRSTPKDVEDLIKRVARMDRANTEIRIEKEGGSGGSFTIDTFQRHVLVGYNVSEGKDKWQRKAKTERAKVTSVAAQAGNVILIADGVWLAECLRRGSQETDEKMKTPWIKDYLNDCDQAPDGFMDSIDAVSGGMIEMRDSVGGGTYKRVPQDRDDELKVASSRRRQILM